jgi:hypothetical protein
MERYDKILQLSLCIYFRRFWFDYDVPGWTLQVYCDFWNNNKMFISSLSKSVAFNLFQERKGAGPLVLAELVDLSIS